MYVVKEFYLSSSNFIGASFCSKATRALEIYIFILKNHLQEHAELFWLEHDPKGVLLEIPIDINELMKDISEGR